MKNTQNLLECKYLELTVFVIN